MSSNCRWFLDTQHSFSFKAEHENSYCSHSNSKDNKVIEAVRFLYKNTPLCFSQMTRRILQDYESNDKNSLKNIRILCCLIVDYSPLSYFKSSIFIL